MHPASTTTASNGLAGALLVILLWLLSVAHVQVPPEVAAAIGAVIASAIGYVMHSKIAAQDAASQEQAAPSNATSTTTNQ